MTKKVTILVVTFLLSGLFITPALAQQDSTPANGPTIDLGGMLALAMAIAAAGCGYAQSKALTAGCEGVSRNPGSADTVRFFIILGLAFIEFLALLTFVVVILLRP